MRSSINIERLFACLLGVAIALGRIGLHAEEANHPVGAPPAAVPPNASPATPTTEKTEDAPEAPVVHFAVLDIAVSGNTVLPTTDVEDAVIPYLGEDKTAADLESARSNLEHNYHDKGYQTVVVTLADAVPASDGVVRMVVTEARVGRLRVVNAQYTTPSSIKALAPSVAEGLVPNINQFQKDVVALNNSNDRTITPDLKNGKQPGTIDVDLVVDEKLPFHGSAEVNNQQTQGTSPLRVIGTASYSNLWQLGHSLSFTYQISPNNTSDTQLYSGTYLARFAGTPWSMQINYLHSDSSATVVGAGGVIGKGDVAGIRGSYALPGNDDFFHTVTFGFDWKDQKQSLPDLAVGGGDVPLTYYPFDASYQATFKEDDAQTDLTAAVIWTFRGIGDKQFLFDNTRAFSRGDFIYLRGSLDRTQNLPWGFSLAGELDGQVSDTPLINYEQFTAGGANSVRGYFEGEVLGDNGARATLELRTPSIADEIAEEFNDLHLLLFADGALLWLIKPLAEQQDQFAVGSLGLGVRLKVFDTLNSAIDFARAYKTAQPGSSPQALVSATPQIGTRAGSYHLLFRTWAEF